MAWNNEPTVRDLKPYADKHKYKAVVAVCFTGNGQFAINSYGQTRKLCDAAKEINNRLFEELSTGEIEVPDALF